jgi:hypothetical protein
MLVQKKLFWCLACRFEDDHFLRCFTNILWCLPYVRDGSFHKMVSILLPKGVISISLQQPCVEEYFSHLSLNLFIWQSPWSSPCMKLPFYGWFLFLGALNGIFQPYHMDFLLRRNCWSNPIKSYLDTSSLEPWWFVAWTSPSDVILWYSAFLLKSLKLGGIASSHSCIAPYHIHHECTIA